MKAKRTIVIGLDGAHFELINPWIRQGYLPNIKSLIEDGVSGDMLSCLPPVTSPNWKCYSTGKNPGKLGIFWWENIDLKNRRIYYPSERKNRSKEIWDYLSEAGYKVCVIGTPLTYPPKKVNGVMISGGLDAEEENFTYPKNLATKLKKKYNYQVRTKFNLELEKEQAVEEIYRLIRLRFEVALDLLSEEDFSFTQVTTFYLNALQHFFWNGEETRRAWQIIDEYVGKFLKETETDLILMSDHGSNRIETVFNINTWLNTEGYLKTTTTQAFARSVSRLGVNKENLSRIVNLFGVESILKKLVPEDIVRLIPHRGGEVLKEAKTASVDWDISAAIASSQGPIYLIDKGRKAEIKNKLEQLKGPDGGRVVSGVYDKKDIYSGEYFDEAPDLIIDQASNIHIKGTIGACEVFEEPQRWKAENKKFALFIAKGPDFPQGKRLEAINILDLAPMILRLYDLSVPIDMDGEDIGRKWI